MNYIVTEIFQGISQEVVLQPCGISDNLTSERYYQSQVLVIKGYHNENSVIRHLRVYGEAVEESTKHSAKCGFVITLNGTSQIAIKSVVIMTMLMYYVMRCPKDTLSNDFVQYQLTRLYTSTIGSIIGSMVYQLLTNNNERRLRQCWKP